MAEDFERWMLAELKDAITERLKACVAEGEPWPGGFIAVPIYVGLSRLYQGMHHPTDLIGSVVIAVGSLLFGFLACQTATTVARLRTTADERLTPTRSEAKVAP